MKNSTKHQNENAHHSSDSIHDKLKDFFPNCVVTSCIIIGCIFFAVDQLLWVEQITVKTSANLVYLK